MRKSDQTRQPETWSIVTRVTVWYALSATVILVAGTQILYWAMARALRNDDALFAVGVVETIEALLRDYPDDLRMLSVEIETESRSREHDRYYARVLEGSGRVIMQTPGMAQSLPPPRHALWPPPLDGQGTSGWREHAPFLLLTKELELSGARRRVELALDITSTEQLLRQHRQRIFLVLFCGIAASALAGVVIARRAMRPVKEITAAAQNVSAAQLKEHIRPERWPVELTALARAFDEMLDRLDDAFTRLSQFSADLAHELRTPLNNIRGQTEVALNRSRSSDEYRQVLESNLEELERLSRMVDSLLFLARAENAQQQVVRTEFDAAQAAREVMEFYEHMAAEEGVTIELTGKAALRADPALFRRALSNLLANAITFSPRGGRISVTVENRAGSVTISVRDQGRGIAPDHLRRVFDRFYRGAAARSAGTSTGLGLAIVRSIMQLHGGDVAVQSEPGQGSIFTLHFPA